MDDNEKIVAAIYAAAATRNAPPDLDNFLGHYESCIAALAVRRAAAREAEVDRNIETMKKTQR